MKEILNILSKDIYKEIYSLKKIQDVQEMRLNINKPLIILSGNKEMILNYKVTESDLKSIMQKISSYSLYAFEEEIRQGYITIQGGHRVGLSGQCVMEKDKVKTIKNISSMNIRICREVKGCSQNIIKNIIKNGQVLNTVIISPPKCGKTTMLRDLAKNISDGIEAINFLGKRTVIVDERSEIAGCFRGIPQMDVGIRTSIYDGCAKSEGMIMAIRSMAPEVIICDEIGTYKDIDSLVLAYNSGVNIIATIHGNTIEDLYKRPVFNELLENKIIKRVVVLSNRNGIGTIEDIFSV
ncbi:MAG: stage III sporulation protein AA [Clostridium perfringens]|nr:stage III sporulation protein AA [Clostridium perfringens]